MRVTKKTVDNLSYKILGCAIEVHRHLGPGLLESVYEKCLKRELQLQGIRVQSQQIIPLNYKGLSLDAELRYDLLVEDLIIVETKANDGLLPIHEAKLLTYMQMLEKPKGILINFNVTNLMKYGQKTMVNKLYAALEDE